MRHSGDSDKLRFRGRLEGGTRVPRFPPQTPPSFLLSTPGEEKEVFGRWAAIAGRNRHEQAETSSEMDRGPEAQDRPGDAPVGAEAERDLSAGGSLAQVYQWRKQLLGAAEAVFGRKQGSGEDRRIAKLATENQRMKNVVAEITAENLDLKKTLLD